jgi:pantoate--beta-alanine ligase
MLIRIDSIAELRSHLAGHRLAGRRIAFVPTMGALHEGHLTLLDVARRHGDVVVMSVFVNPLQFGAGEDLDRYPRNIERDLELAGSRGADVVFTPTVHEMYGKGDEVRVVAGDLASRWEGAARPGHFDGVLTVVTKLFNIVQPDVACFGRKDLQQATLIARMIEQLDFPIELVVVPTVRDHDGLALSSRNAFLSDEERQVALRIPSALAAAAQAWRDGERDAASLEQRVAAVLAAGEGLTPDYIAVIDPVRLEPVQTAPAGTVIAVAAQVGSTRLIDNIVLGE